MIRLIWKYFERMMYKYRWIVLISTIILLVVPIYDFSKYSHILLYFMVLIIYAIDCLIFVLGAINHD